VQLQATGSADTVKRVAKALAPLGATPTREAIVAALASALGKAPTDETVEDLATAIRTPLREAWSKEQAQARSDEIVAALGLRLSEDRRSQSFRKALSGAVLDIATPAVLLPAQGGTPSGMLGFQVTGQPVMNRGLSRSVTANQLRSFFFALLVVFMIMTFLFRSLWSGLLGIVPASLAMLAIYGVMGIFHIRLDIGTSLLGSMIIGAGVDYAIHMLAAWHMPEGGSWPEAARVAAERSGLGVWCNALMVAAGFFTLTLGEARPLKIVGGLVAAAMIAGALATYLSIPVLARRRAYRPQDPLTEEALVASTIVEARRPGAA